MEKRRQQEFSCFLFVIIDEISYHTRIKMTIDYDYLHFDYLLFTALPYNKTAVDDVETSGIKAPRFFVNHFDTGHKNDELAHFLFQ